MVSYVLEEKHILKIFLESIKYWLLCIADLHTTVSREWISCEPLSLGGTVEQFWQFLDFLQLKRDLFDYLTSYILYAVEIQQGVHATLQNCASTEAYF